MKCIVFLTILLRYYKRHQVETKIVYHLCIKYEWMNFKVHCTFYCSFYIKFLIFFLTIFYYLIYKICFFLGIPIGSFSWRWNRVWYGNAFDIKNKRRISRQNYEYFFCSAKSKSKFYLFQNLYSKVKQFLKVQLQYIICLTTHFKLPKT